MKLKVKYHTYDYELTVHYSTWFPFFSQGWYAGFGIAFVKYVYYKNTKVICKEETEDVVKHEYSHFILHKTKYKNWFMYSLAYLGWKGMMIVFPHSIFPFEYEANKIKATL